MTTIELAETPDVALSFLSTNTPDAIFITDRALIGNANSLVLDRVVSYVCNGGTAIFGGRFSSFAGVNELGSWFRSHWGLPWQSGHCYQTTVYLNPSAERVPRSALSVTCSQKPVI